MEWIKDYWYVIVLGLCAAMFIFGYRSDKGQTGGDKDDGHGKHTRGGHGCCH